MSGMGIAQGFTMLGGAIHGGIAGSMTSHHANKVRRLARTRGREVLWGSKEGFTDAFQNGTLDPSKLGGTFGRLSSLYDKGEQELRTGYREAREEVGQIGAESRRSILERGEQGVADARQGAISRGLYGSRAEAINRRQADRDTERRMSELDERLAGIRAGLRERQAQALAQHYGMRWAAESPLFALQFDLMTGLTLSATSTAQYGTQGWFDGLGAGASAASVFGGGGGGGGGSPTSFARQGSQGPTDGTSTTTVISSTPTGGGG